MERNNNNFSAARVVTDAGETSDEAAPTSPQHPPDDDSKLRCHATPDELFDENLDDQDEAYVYKHLRSGLVENVPVRSKDAKLPQQLSAYKPRSSDAVLSCPCCFNIVCMDCQRHERYAEQYRAMFVMGIVVKWDQRLVVSPKGLVPAAPESSMLTVVAEEKDSKQNNRRALASQEQEEGPEENGTVYYAVCCADCDTTVASLDMTDEVYHFYGCLAST